MRVEHRRKLIVAIAMAASLLSHLDSTLAADVDNGEQIYARRCVFCHGEDGDGLGAVAERLNPPPRDFTAGMYKIMTTEFDGYVPQDDDILRMIRDGMPGTNMPAWGDVLTDEEMLDLVAFIKTFAGYEEEQPGPQVDYGEQIATSPESVAKGKEIFHDGDRCTECHGAEGKGDAIKRLKDDNGDRTWPRNLTKPWTFRGSNDPADIFTRISTGIPGTQMPSFADPESKKKLTIEERWHVANYVSSLAKTDRQVRAENTVVKADRLDGELPRAADDPKWEQTEPTTVFLVPQIIAKERLFTPSNDTITIRALYNERDITLLLEWDDRTKSIPGDEKAEKISDPEIAQDAVAVQLPVEIPSGMEKPYFGMGDTSNPVNIWQWKSGTSNTSESTILLNAHGFADIETRDAAATGVESKGVYHNGTWRVVMTRPLATAELQKDIQITEGQFIPVAFAAWDGSNSEKGSQHTMTTWYWLLLKPPTGAKPLIAAFAAFSLVIAAQFLWARSASRKSPAA
jgi:DMSO reductase family type II enzyme heme b subunit